VITEREKCWSCALPVALLPVLAWWQRTPRRNRTCRRSTAR